MKFETIEEILPNTVKKEWNERYNSSSDSEKLDMLRVELAMTQLKVKEINNVFKLIKNYISDF